MIFRKMKNKFEDLRKFNLLMGGLHLAQGLLILLLSSDFALPITTNYLTFNPLQQSLAPAGQQISELQLGPMVAVFLFLSALAHLFIATKWRKTYEAQLKKGKNYARWVEYSLSASLMMVLIAMLVGVYDLMSLFMIFALTAVMNLMGLVMELHNQSTKKTDWTSFKVGTLAGIIPWLVVGWYFYASSTFGNATPPTFVYWIYVTIFVFFNLFAVNMWLQYKRIGKWKDYLYGERMYIVLSLVAKSALAWQVYAGTLSPL